MIPVVFGRLCFAKWNRLIPFEGLSCRSVKIRVNRHHHRVVLIGESRLESYHKVLGFGLQACVVCHGPGSLALERSVLSQVLVGPVVCGGKGQCPRLR
eukprot:symbB.v1.2.018806.t1/scaffold1452.1/size117917/5